MKSSTKYIGAFVFFAFLFAFIQPGDETVNVIQHGKDKEYLIHLKKVKDSLSLKLSDFASDFKFIRLETKKECLLGDAKFYVTGDYILAEQPNQGILQFNMDGRFIRNLVRVGKGPAEYFTMSNWVVDENNQILYLNDYAKPGYFLHFDLKSGKYIGNLKKAFPGMSASVMLTDDNNLMVSPAVPSKNTDENCYLYVQDFSGNLIRKIISPAGLSVEPQSATLFNGKEPFRYHLRDRDTLFTIQKTQLIPFMIFDHGEANPARGIAGHKSMWLNFETTDWVAFYNFYLTSNITSGSTTGDLVHYFLDKKAGRAYKQGRIYFNPTHEYITPFNSQYIVFQKNGIIQKDYQAIDLLEQTKKALADPKFSEPYRTQLKVAVSNLRQDDNPVMVIGRYK